MQIQPLEDLRPDFRSVVLLLNTSPRVAYSLAAVWHENAGRGGLAIGSKGGGRALDTPLTYAKITAPSAGTTVKRARLLERLDRAHERRLTWISGPAGCGKTTLVADYVQQKKARCLWYQVDHGDGDPAAMFHFLHLAVQTATTRSRKVPPPEFAPAFLPGLEVFARRFFRDLFAQLPSPLLIVFDNVQDAPPDSAFYDVLREGLFELPPGSHAILISRSEPHATFSGLLAKREMALIGWEDLRFTTTEVEQLFGLFGQKARFRDRAQNILSVTQGWVAGIVLMTAVADEMDFSRPIPKDAPVQTLFDYFATEVLRKVDAAVRSFLLHTAFLPEMTVLQAEEVTGNLDAGNILAALSRENFFTSRQSSRQPIYRYHPLFRAFLQNCAEASLSAEHLKTLRGKTASLLELVGQVEAACELFIAIEDWQSLSRMVCSQAPILMAKARIKTLAGWVGAIPEELKDRSPDLLYWDGMTRVGFDLEQSLCRLERSFTLCRERNDANGEYIAWSGMVDAIVAAWVDFRPFDQCISEFRALQGRHLCFPSKEIEARALSNIVFAIAHRRICDPILPNFVYRLSEVIQEPLDLTLRVSAGASLVVCLSGWCNFAKAQMILETIRPNSRRECPPQVWILFQVANMLFCWLTASFGDCRRAEKEAIDTIRDTGAWGMELLVLNQALSCALSDNDRNRARELLSRLSAILNTGGPLSKLQQSHPLRWMYHYYFAWNDLLEGKLSVAREHGEWSLNYAERMGELFVLLSRVAAANVAIEMGDVQWAEIQLAAIAEIDRENTFILLHVTKLFVEADLAHRTGNSDKCLATLHEAFALARTYSLKNTEFWLPKQMADLSVLALEAEIEVDYVRSLVRERNLRPETAPRHVEAWPWPLAVQTLGNFVVSRNGEQLSFRGKAQRKPMDLLKALIALGGRGVSIARLQDALWPDADGDAAERAFDITLHRLRKLLQVEGVLDRSESRLSLSAHLCWVDVWALNDLIEMALTAIGASPTPGSAVDIDAIGAKILRLDQGAFLEHLSDEPWASYSRYQISKRLGGFYRDFGRYWERQGQPDRASEFYQRGLDAEARYVEASLRYL